jgi:hypothetical protein
MIDAVLPPASDSAKVSNLGGRTKGVAMGLRIAATLGDQHDLARGVLPSQKVR